MSLSTWSPRHYYYVYRVTDDTRACDIATHAPAGGVTMRGWQPIEVVAAAYLLAVDRYVCHAGEFIAILEVHGDRERKQVLALEEEWLCEVAELENWWVLT